MQLSKRCAMRFTATTTVETSSEIDVSSTGMAGPDAVAIRHVSPRATTTVPASDTIEKAMASRDRCSAVSLRPLHWRTRRAARRARNRSTSRLRSVHRSR